ncbi:metal ABC transporter substrate-binding protein [Myxococcota bacterium]|nr:metal ABC transporter substrate-binding protein [Myxococcota bacterium]
MKPFGHLVTLVLATLTTLAATEARADLTVVATVSDLAAIARDVGGDHVKVTSLALPTQDPHFVDARPHLALELSRADLLLTVGLDLEIGWLPTLLTGSRNGRIQTGGAGFLDCSTLVDVLDVPAHKVDRSMGDVHPGGNPHYLYDPRAGAKVADGIAKKMAELDPSNAALYAKNAAALLARLDAARAKAETDLASLRGAKLVAQHKTLSYLSQWLGFTVVEHIEPRPGIPPSPSHVARVLTVAKAAGARAVVVEAYYPETTAKLVAERAGVPLVKLPGGADVKGGESYVARIERLAAALAAAVKRGA